MARKVEEFTAVTSTSRARYPYDEWLDGSIYEIVRGDDFGEEGADKPKVASVVSVIRGEAHKRGLGLKAQVIDDNTVQIQATEKRQRRTSSEDGDTAEKAATTSSAKSAKGGKS